MELVELNKHRERAIDVPESFVGIVKQSPRYPPPQPRTSLTRNDLTAKRSATDAQQVDPFLHSTAQQNAAHPGAFSSPTHTFHSLHTANSSSTSNASTHHHNNNNNNSINSNANASHKMSLEADRLKRYSHELQRKRTEDELLRCSLRDSKKLQQLVHHYNQPPPSASSTNHLPSSHHHSSYSHLTNGNFNEPRAIVNRAFESDEIDFQSAVTLPSSSQSAKLDWLATIHRLPDALDRLMVECADQHSNSSQNQFAQLVANTSFDQLLRVYCDVMQRQAAHQQSPFELLHTLPNVSLGDLVQQTISSLQSRASTSNEAAELLNLLSKFELDGLCVAFDKIHHNQRVLAELQLQQAQSNPLSGSSSTQPQSIMMRGNVDGPFSSSLHHHPQHMDGKSFSNCFFLTHQL